MSMLTIAYQQPNPTFHKITQITVDFVIVMNRPANINRTNVPMGTQLMHMTKDSQPLGSGVSMSQ